MQLSPLRVTPLLSLSLEKAILKNETNFEVFYNFEIFVWLRAIATPQHLNRILRIRNPLSCNESLEIIPETNGNPRQTLMCCNSKPSDDPYAHT